MSNYTKTTDFDVKDSLPSGDTGKIIRGSEFEVEFENIEVAIASKADSLNTVLTGNTSVTNLSVTGNTTLGNAASDTVTVNADFSSDLLPSADATYDLGAPGSEWQDLYVTGTANVDSLVADTVAISGGTVTATLTGNVTGNLTGTVLTAAQPNITSVGTLTSLDVSGDITFGDNDKAVFGAGPDLQIYHDGSNSIIEDVGTGSLDLKGSAAVYIKAAGTDESMAAFVKDGGAFLYHNNVEKLETTASGVEVTGIVTADNGVFETASVVAQSTNATFAVNVSGGTSLTSTISQRAKSSNGANAETSMVVTGSGGEAIGSWDFKADTINGALTKVMTLDGNGDVSFYEDTGTTPKLFWDASAESLGIGTTSPSNLLHVAGASAGALELARFRLEGATNNPMLKIEADEANQTAGIDVSGSTPAGLTFSEGGVERMRIDSSGNVGIGTESPAYRLDVDNGTSSNLARFACSNASLARVLVENTDTTDRRADIAFQSNSTVYGVVGFDGTNLEFDARGTAEHVFELDGAEAMRIDNSGNVGIGTTSPNNPLHVIGQTRIENSGDAARLVIARNDNANSADSASLDLLENASANKNFGEASGFGFRLECDGNANTFNIKSGNGTTTSTRFSIARDSGNVGIGTTSPTDKLHLGGTGARRVKFNLGSGSGFVGYDGSNDDVQLASQTQIRFQTGSSFTESARIDASGNLLVGTSNNSPVGANVTGVGLFPNGSGQFSRDGGTPLLLNRKTSDGTILDFRKDGTAVGVIGTEGAALTIGTGDTGLRFSATSDALVPFDVTGNAARDNAIDLGATGARFDDVYATNGTIQTSDFNEKQDIDVLSEAEQRVAVACKGLLRKFRWKSAVEEKGEDARIHFGIIAQDLQAAFEAEGLDAGRYAMFISSTWTDEETGEERTRLGVRYSELLAFIIAAI